MQTSISIAWTFCTFVATVVVKPDLPNRGKCSASIHRQCRCGNPSEPPVSSFDFFAAVAQEVDCASNFARTRVASITAAAVSAVASSVECSVAE
eukprot:m.185700 g.185700  ORF g.185700 m.185700 type:complete len:94 (-) comp24742_c0_seq2:1525-1806(-)